MMPISDQQRTLVRYLTERQVLKFGSFTTKSGRHSPFFFNTAQLYDGQVFSLVASMLAEAVHQEAGPPADFLFGPAYKGIPLVAAAATELHLRFHQRVGFAFNRKESKEHGEGGSFVGPSPDAAQHICVLEDVLTAGTSLRETMKLNFRSRIKSVWVVIDRQERGIAQTACSEFSKEFGIPVRSLLTLDQILEYIKREGPSLSPELWDALARYRDTFGAVQK